MLTRSQNVIRYLVGSYASQDSALGPLLRAIPLNATTRQVLSLSRPEQRTYLENLWLFNHEQAKKEAPVGRAQTALYKIRTTAGLIRRFNQLPCTVESRERRADLLAGLDKAVARILVLGDDDLLSVELARRGFARTVAADCDETLLERIRAETKACPTPPEVLHADFRVGFRAPVPADVVFTDPPYSLDGAKAFLRLAVEAAATTPGTRIFLMINPDIFGARFSEISGVATRAGFRLARHRPRFNAYPIGILESTALKAAWSVLMGRPVPRLCQSGLLFCSDCFEFVRE